MDLSCGSGLFSRQFIKSGKFKNVIAADFSENMLKQTSRFIQEDQSIDPGYVELAPSLLPFTAEQCETGYCKPATCFWTQNGTLQIAFGIKS